MARSSSRLRVLVVITRGEPGGAQMHVRDVVTGLAGQVEFHVAIGDDEFLAGALRTHGIPVHVVPELQRDVAVMSDLHALRALRTLITSLNPHLVHTHSSKAGLLGRLAARIEGVPALHTAHAWSFSDGIPRRRKAFTIPTEALASRWTHRFIVVSEADREVAVRHRVARTAQIRTVHNGVPDVPERAHPDAPVVPVVTMVARMATPKDHVLLLRAVAAIQAPFFVRFVGDGPDRAVIEREIRSHGLEDRVELLGVRDDVPAILAASHVFALISRQEGFPLAILEGMRAGLPVVASDVGGVREAVRPGATGFLIPRGDTVALHDALQQLIEDAPLRGRLGRSGRAVYEAEFTVDRMLAGTLGVYCEIARECGFPVPADFGGAR